MSYNGSGTFTINSTGQPVVAGTVITATAFNALTTDLATGLTTAITKDGQTTTTARITFAQGITSSLVTDSSSISTGSIITDGGVGIAKALYVGTTANVAGAVTLGGIATFSAQPIFSSLTASSAVATNASKGLVSVTNTGTGNNVLATSPTITTPTISSLSSATATALTLQSAGTTAITVDTSQNVGIGVTPSAWVSGDTVVQVKAGSSSGALWGRSNSVRVVGNTYYDGTNYKYIASDYASFLNINPGSVGGFSWNIAPSGTAGTNATFTTAMTLDASGNLLVGTTTSQGKITVLGSNGGTDIAFTNTSGTASYYACAFYNNGTTYSYCGGITVSGTTTAYATSSDYRLKDNISPMTGALATVAQLKPVNYKWKFDGSNGQGFIAHELQEVVPECVVGEKDAVDAEGNPKYQGIDTSFLVATLTAAIQELKAINDTQAETINALTARITALENA